MHVSLYVYIHQVYTGRRIEGRTDRTRNTSKDTDEDTDTEEHVCTQKNTMPHTYKNTSDIVTSARVTEHRENGKAGVRLQANYRYFFAT